MRRTSNFQPLLAIDFVIADYPTHTVVKDLGAASGKRVHTGFDQPLECLTNRKLAALRQVRDLHHGERFEMDFRETLLEPAEHFAIPIQCQLRMQAPDDVELGHSLRPSLAGAVPDFFERPGVSLGV